MAGLASGLVLALVSALPWAASGTQAAGGRDFGGGGTGAAVGPDASLPLTPAPPPPPAGGPDMSVSPAPPASEPATVSGGDSGPGAGPAFDAVGPAAPTSPSARPKPPPTSSTSTLVLYDTSGTWGWLGGLYAEEAANLVSHFGTWTAQPVASYKAGQLGGYTATIYIGSTYDEPLPAAFLSDVSTATKPVIWLYDNIWQLETYMTYNAFGGRYGWEPGVFDLNAISTVTYRGTALTRDHNNAAGILTVLPVGWGATSAQVLATATEDATGSTIPWAVRSSGLTYIGEIPFAYASETDRILAYDDLLFDALAPATTARHQAIVRLEDISPANDPTQVKAVADWLYSQHIPFGFGVTPWYKDPLGYYTDGKPVSQKLTSTKGLVDVLKYLEAHGGTLVEHGYTHQWDGAVNPYDEVTGDDLEFYRVTENADHSLTYQGPVPGDSLSWNSGRISSSSQLLKQVKLGTPTIWETPHYAGSVNTYTAVNNAFSEKWERTLYFPGYWSGTPDYNPAHLGGQFFPFVVRDVYGTKVLPENLGNISPDPWFTYPARLPADLINAAAKNLVVRDGFAAFYFHTYLDLSYLQQTVAGIRSLGYSFVDPAGL